MRRTNFSGIPARSSATRPKPPLCRIRSVAFRTCSSLSTGEDARASTNLKFEGADFSILVDFGGAGVLARALYESLCWLHRIQSSFVKSRPAAVPDVGSKLSLASIRTHDSSLRDAAAIVASSTLVFPDEAVPQISVKQPRGMPPVIASSSAMPLDSISGLGRTSSCDAGLTEIRRSECAICLRTAARLCLRICSGQESNPVGKSGKVPAFSGRVDIETSRQKDLGWCCPVWQNQSRFAFYSPKRFCYCTKWVVKRN